MFASTHSKKVVSKGVATVISPVLILSRSAAGRVGAAAVPVIVAA